LFRNDDPLSERVKLAEATIWEPEEWTAAGSSTAGIHYLYVYQVGDRLCARRLGQGSTGFQPVASQRLEASSTKGLCATIDGHHEPLIGGPLRIAATGRLTVGLAPERHGTIFDIVRAPISLPEPSTGDVALSYDALKPDAVTISTDFLTATGALYGETPPTPPITGVGWQMTVSGLPATGPTLHLTRVRFQLSEAVEDDGLVGTDLNTLTPAGIGGSGTIASVELRRGRDPEAVGLSATIHTQPDDVAPYLQPNMRGSYAPAGAQTLDFATIRPTVRPGLYADTLTLDTTSGHQRLRSARWTDARTYGGRLLAQAYRDVALKAGLETTEVDVYTGGYELPAEKADGEPVMDFRPGQTNAEIIAYLRDQFGPSDYHRWESDGKLYARVEPTALSGVVFTWSTDPADLADIADRAETTPRVGDDFEWTWAEASLVNDVWVVGRDRDGKPLCAVATDWPSVRDTDAPNYVAGWQRMTIIDGELQTQAMCNWVARSVLDRLCRQRLTCSFTSLAYEDLYEGDLVEIEPRSGEGANSIWRIIGYSRTDELTGSSRARYELEYVREGEAPS
ncbi:MAG: hypothetical protein HZB16_07250, partial [Armatimonadetes bacterium]|nr:hypothetical protein [Armatimonadota bacterium]